MPLRTIPIHQSFTRPNLVLGCDRELIICSGIVAFALVISAQRGSRSGQD
ncbi:MAG: VirB3 family type IV secretion system protein [Bilophila wadsworthia]